jgi:hypothetical protein
LDGRSYSRLVGRFTPDEDLPDQLRPPRPSGWFEVFCCGGIVLGFVALIVTLALLSR